MGERLSFYRLIDEKKYVVEIPIIQRDYAQGRASASEIRSQFLSALKEYLLGNESIDLDFIYGSLKDGGSVTLFTPLDGQQRLTTLFLLHWYLALKENKLSEFQNIMLLDGKTKFSYETRITSRDFCYALISNDIVFPGNISIQISEEIKNSSWFFSSWLSDPTINSMLVVLDDIHKLFFETSNLYGKLIDTDKQIICFQFIELENFGLNDSLYVKMNSRGKELTYFENFKAKMEQYIQKQDLVNHTNINSEFSIKIDRDWTDLFWNYRDTRTNLFDDQLMNFIRVIVTNNYALKTSDISLLENNIELLVDKTEKIHFSKYMSEQFIDNECLNDIIMTLDLLKNGENKAKNYVINKNLIDEDTLFNKVIQNQLTYYERILFWSHYKYLIANQSHFDDLEDWIRIIRNLAFNTTYNTVEDYSRSIKSISFLLQHSRNILEYFSSPTSQIGGFFDPQIQEERIKAILKLKSSKWKESIIKVEDHNYFVGQIDFLLKFSGIKEYYLNNENLNWSEEDDQVFFHSFNEYSKKFKFMFCESGLNELDNYLWHRALLSKGDYLLSKGRNKSFLIDSIDERDISWKRLLRNDNTKRDLLKTLIDEIDIETAKQDLEQIISEDTTEDWRKHFIKRPKMFNPLSNKKFIRWESGTDILLLEKSQTNGWHYEYYSYALYIKLCDFGNEVTYQGSNSIDYLKYISDINGNDLKIYFAYTSQGWRYVYKPNEGDLNYFISEDEVINFLKEGRFIN